MSGDGFRGDVKEKQVKNLINAPRNDSVRILPGGAARFKNSGDVETGADTIALVLRIKIA